ncbi:MAG: cyclohexanecarboxylate-CoA ligase [Acidimicrobiaceae bacterium]|nr:cyclohexanecarboxylate-CoA ligase [Acidimicrobiaceae bacterium]
MTLDGLLAGAPARDDLVVDSGGQHSSAEVESRVEAVAAALEARDVAPGDRVAFRLPVGVDAVVAYRACWRIGAVAVALHPAAGSHQLAQALEQARPAVVVAGDGLPPAPGYHPVAVDELAAEAGGTAAARAVTGDDDAVVMFTSGSTGTPRGVVHTHGSLAYKAVQLTEAHGLTRDDCALVPSPLAHVAGLLHAVLLAGAFGMKTVLVPRWEPEEALGLIERESVTYMVGPPTLFTTLMDCDGFAPSRAATLRMISCGGAGVTPAFCRRAAAALGVVVKRSYGSTEAPTVATSRFDDPPDRMILTDGRAFGEARLRVDRSGELWVTGPELARGYLNPADTEAAFVDGWFRTGDLATLDDGWVTITGRLGDRIIRSGENISAAEVEQHLEAHPAVLQAAAVAEPDDRLGERVAAFVVAPGGFDLVACREWFARRGAARFITPERIEVLDELPVLASGKVDRMKLAARLRKDAGRAGAGAP